MQDSQPSPTTTASRPFSVVPPPRKSLLAAGHPGVRPPLDVRQTCVLMFVAAVLYGLLAYLVGSMLSEGVHASVTTELWLLLAMTVLVGLGLVALALPVRRAGHVLWRASQAGSLFAFGTALFTLFLAARLADTPLMLAGIVAALFAIVLNIALWSTGVRRWCHE